MRGLITKPDPKTPFILALLAELAVPLAIPATLLIGAYFGLFS